MLKKTVTYEDFDGKTQTEDLFFHLTKAELFEFVAQYPGEFTDYVQRISRSDDKSEILAMFRDLILKSYGVRSGPKFIKTPAQSEEFSHTEAYSAMFLELFQKPETLIAFFNALLGVDVEKVLAEAETKKE